MDTQARPAPKSPRDLFLLLAQLQPDEALEHLLANVDVAEMTAATVYRSVFSDAPDLASLPLPFADYDARSHLAAIIRSPAFQENCLGNILKAFPEKHRTVFLHIPKCSGTDLIANLADHQVSLSKRLEDRGWTDTEAFLRTIARTMGRLQREERVFLHGHITLREYVRLIGLRMDDRIFSILRDPIEQLVSQVNYAISRIVQDPLGQSPDARAVLDTLGLNRLPEQARKADLRQLALAYLRRSEVFDANPICKYLSDSPTPSFTSALRSVIFYNIELTETVFYNPWLESRWGIQSKSRRNRSTTFINREDVFSLPVDVLEHLAGEDQKLFDTVNWAIRHNRTLSIDGQGLRPLLRSQEMIDALPARLSRQRGRFFPVNPVDVAGLHNIAVIAGDQAVTDFRAKTASIDIERAADVLLVRFGEHGNCQRYIQTGWSPAERTYRWAVDGVSTICLPRPAEAGTYRFELDIEPFLVEDLHARQRITIRINGSMIGTTDLLERCIVQFSVGWTVLDRGSNVTIEIDHPDAAKPSQLSRVSDDRVLAFMAKALLITRV